jgi:hypothetical protein
MHVHRQNIWAPAYEEGKTRQGKPRQDRPWKSKLKQS